MRRLAVLALMSIPSSALPPPEPTHPGFIDVARLEALCSADGPGAASARAICLGYVTGVADALLLPRGRGRGPRLCPPEDPTPAMAVAAVMRHQRYASAAHGIGAADFVRFALERAWPCPVEGVSRAPSFKAVDGNPP